MKTIVFFLLACVALSNAAFAQGNDGGHSTFDEQSTNNNYGDQYLRNRYNQDGYVPNQVLNTSESATESPEIETEANYSNPTFFEKYTVSDVAVQMIDQKTFIVTGTVTRQVQNFDGSGTISCNLNGDLIIDEKVPCNCFGLDAKLVKRNKKYKLAILSDDKVLHKDFASIK